MVATDLSSRSELAVMRAAALAKARNAELTVLNVLDDDQPPVLIAPQRLAIANLLEVNGQALKERLGVESKAIDAWASCSRARAASRRTRST
ncbi:universal stress protein [Pseudomonas aeruginosa]|nr:universal stress protein [Pseudomonas aeruginosa]